MHFNSQSMLSANYNQAVPCASYLGLRNHWHLRQMKNGLLLVFFYFIFFTKHFSLYFLLKHKRNKRWTAMVFMQTLYSLIAARTIQLNRFAYYIYLFCPAFIEMIYNLIIAFHVSFVAWTWST